MTQLKLFPDPEPSDETPTYYPDTDEVRADLTAMLVALRGAAVMPWDQERVRLNRLIFQQMSNWLPADEAEALRSEFNAHMERLAC